MTDQRCGQPADENLDESKIYAPSCDDIPKDENLNYSNPSFKESIQEVKETSSENIHFFPEPHVFAHFSLIAYDDDPIINADLAPGWEVLTTATNTRTWSQAIFRTAPSNGYFGVALWHSEKHQLVIAHRGTIPSCIAALKTDYHGVIHNQYVWQIFSAATFAIEVVEAIRKKKVHFQLFFTGHSLGGWLAQITTLIIKYLYLEANNGAESSPKYFRLLPAEKIDSEEFTSAHAHTVVFDSPGCKPMLLKLADGFDVRYYGKRVQVTDLDITSYMSAPNWVNTRNAHVGTIYRLYFHIKSSVSIENIGYSWLNVFAKFKELYEKWYYTNAAHDKKKFLEVLLLRENARIREVVDWPESIGVSGGKELDGYLKWAAEENKFIPPLKHSFSNELPGYCTIRYQVKVPEKSKRTLNVFTQNERDFLEQYQLVRTFQDESESELSEDHRNLLSDYKTDNLYIHSSAPDKVNRLAAGLSFILRKYENLSKLIQQRLRPAGVATFDYLKSINQNDYSFNSNLQIVTTILESGDKIWELTAQDSTAAFIRFVDSLKKEIIKRQSSSSSSCEATWRYTALSYQMLMKLTCDGTLLPPELMKGPHILATNCGHLDTGQKKRIDELKRRLKQSSNTKMIKFILIFSSNTNWFGNDSKFISSWEWRDLSTDSKRRLMGKTIVLQGKHVILSNILFNVGRPENLSEKDLNENDEFKLSESDIMRLMLSDSVTVTVGGEPPRISELEAAFVKCGNSIRQPESVLNFIKSCKEKNVAFIFSIVTPSSSSLLLENIELNRNKVYTKNLPFIGNNFFEENEKFFKEFCKENKLHRAYWFSIIQDKWKLEMKFDANFFVDRDIYRIANKKFVRGSISEFKFLNFSSTDKIRSLLNISVDKVSDDSLEKQMISGDVSMVEKNTKYILMYKKFFQQQFVLYEKSSQDNLNVLHGETISVLVDEPGMGKSTTLVKLGEAEYESYWVIHLPLKHCNLKKNLWTKSARLSLDTWMWKRERYVGKSTFPFSSATHQTS